MYRVGEDSCQIGGSIFRSKERKQAITQSQESATGVPKINVTLDFQATVILPQTLKVKSALKDRLYLKMVDASSNESGGV